MSNFTTSGLRDEMSPVIPGAVVREGPVEPGALAAHAELELAAVLTGIARTAAARLAARDDGHVVAGVAAPTTTGDVCQGLTGSTTNAPNAEYVPSVDGASGGAS